MNNRVSLFGFCLGSAVLLLTALPCAAAPPPLIDITAALRQRLDHVAALYPLDTLHQEQLKLAGELSLWALSQLALDAEDERQHAQDVYRHIIQHERVLKTPAAVRRVLDKLLDKLPARLKPDAFDYKIIVVDQSDANVFTLGGGFIYFSRPLLEALLADKKRGETALAFILAQQLGHIGLQHTRRGWQMQELEGELQKGIALHVERPRLRQVLQTGVAKAGDHIKFLYSRRQVYHADLFAWQLCRNCGVPLDDALDALRWLAVVEHPRLPNDETYRPAHPARGQGQGASDTPPALLRLRRLLMERDGLVDDKDGKYGLFIWDARAETFARCGRQSIAAGAKPIVFLHGFRGNLATFRHYLRAVADDRALRGRALLAFRYPNNASLGRCGEYLCHEMRRVVAAPDKAVFVCHSAGGLVLRWYAETRKRPFDRAVMLSTPHEGTSVTSLKYLAELGGFFAELKMDGPGALARMLPEGDGQILHDVQPDSLFLRYLGHNADLAKRYHVFSGEYLTSVQVLALTGGISAAKRVLTKRVLPRIESAVLRRQAMRRVERWHLPREISRGDLVVSVSSALLKDAGRRTRTSLNHEQLLNDDRVIAKVLAAIAGK